MTIRIYNTLSGTKEEFIPIEPGKVRMYVCGPTVYDYSHIGHARSVVVFDVIARYLRACGYAVTYVRNFTDVDDKIIRRAAELDKDPRELAETFIRAFHEDMDALHVERPDHEPKVTEHIESIQRFVSRLVDKDAAYAVEGNVYFSVDRFPDYGKLSKRSLEEMEAGARVEVDQRKQNPFDFALWKAAKPGEPFWRSPWGDGRPGWHIECSAMSGELLGETFDIHGGGKDLIFPHHENEIAQSEAAFGRTFARYWVHNGFVNIDKEKMSKSVGNFLTVRDVLRTHHPETVRMFLLSSHYRSPLDFSSESMEEAIVRLNRLYGALLRVEKGLGLPEAAPDGDKGPHWSAFSDAMNDDFNSALALGVLFEAARELNGLLDTWEAGEDAATLKEKILGRSRELLYLGGSLLGFFQEQPSAFFERQQHLQASRHDVDPESVDRLITERAEARKSKDWAAADRIRDQLEAMNVQLEDRADGTVWKFRR